ncbi:SAM-dependent methyltransferase [Spinactinospora alkalitolerans]|uniref:SAM-dependent methyltransferase n=1 Tax=Spinactinospora alkalitolerans TaxID=687207 RepID=A0A852TT18_9ACTN|nr:class I SAM-dependent methyltransferase [Spinactinospora alkalitolerans]NYE47586.1 SAM-dependent methyltransferase [Spinactinospora alkalitolerans]
MDGHGSRWAEMTGGGQGARYAARFAELADSGADVHGEARFCAGLLRPGSRVLDAGCGTGRVAIRLAELGHACAGVDLDPSMLAEARRRAPAMTWLEADLTDVASLGLEPGFDMVVAAGNVIPLLAPDTEAAVVGELASMLGPGGLLVAGFGLDARNLPLASAPTTLADYDAWCAAAGLALVRRHATWDGDDYDGGGYAVSVHRLTGAAGTG